MMRALALITCAGCSNVLGIGDLAGPSDAAPTLPDPDAPVQVPGTIRITGTVEKIDLLGGVMTALPNSEVSLVDQQAGIGGASTISDAEGRFELVITTNGMPLDGALRGSSPNERTTVQYFSQPVVDNVETTMQIYDDELFPMLAQVCQVPFDMVTPVYFVTVTDRQGSPVEGVPLTSNPISTFCSQQAGGFMNNNQTGSGGIAFDIQLPPGQVTLSAGGPARTFTGEPLSTVLAPLSTAD